MRFTFHHLQIDFSESEIDRKLISKPAHEALQTVLDTPFENENHALDVGSQDKLLELISWHLGFEVNDFFEALIVKDVPTCDQSLVLSAGISEVVLIEDNEVNVWQFFAILVQNWSTKCLYVNLSIEQAIKNSVWCICIFLIHVF